MAALFDDARIANGMKVQLARRSERLGRGERPIGWKAGFGAPAALAKLRLDGPMVGFMTDRSIVESGAAVSIEGWTKPIAEPEVAIHIGADVPGGADEATIRRAIAALGPAIELADLDAPAEDVEAILGGNIFHRYVVLGAPDRSRAGGKLEGLTARITHNGTEVVTTTELEANTGTLVAVVRRVADTLAEAGERLAAGEVVIAGSMVPALALEPSDTSVGCTIDPIGGVTVRFA